jgi:hypothetical protein
MQTCKAAASEKGEEIRTKVAWSVRFDPKRAENNFAFSSFSLAH